MAGYNSYRVFRKQYSLDNGLTWADVDPIVGESRFITSYNTFDECALDTYKAIFYMENGDVMYIPCDGSDTLNGTDYPRSGYISLLVVGNCVRSIGGFASIRRVDFPRNGILERIEGGAFSNSGLGYEIPLYTLYIPDTVTYIGPGAFDCTEVYKFDIGSGVTYIGRKAFARGGGPTGNPSNRHFFFRGEIPPTFEESNPPGQMFQETRSKAYSQIHVPCGSEWAYYNAISNANYDSVSRETIYNYIPSECNWSAKLYSTCQNNEPEKIPLKAGVQSSAYTSGITDIEIAVRSDVQDISYNLNGSVLNKIEIPDTIGRISLLRNFTTERLFTNKVLYIYNKGGLDKGGIRDAHIDYFEYGTEVPMTISEDSIRVTGTTCRIGEYGHLGEYSGNNLKFDNVIIERDAYMSLGMSFKNGKINNLYVLPNQLSNYSGQTQYYNHIYAIGEQTGTTWVPAKREYLHDAETGKYYYKEYERKDFENGMWYYTKNYRQGNEITNEPYWVACSTIIVDEENGIDWNSEAKVLLIGDNEVPLYQLRKSTPNKSYQYKFKWRYSNNETGETKVECSGQTTLSRGLASNQWATSVKIYDNCCTSIGDSAFANQSYLTSLNIPDTVESIGTSAFSWCTNSQLELIMPESVTSVGNAAFAWSRPKNISSNITSAGTSAFCYSTLSGVINIPSGLTYVSAGMFYDCENITSVNVNDNVTYIDNNAFSYCINLKDVTLGNSLYTIGSKAFIGCTALTGVNMPNSVTNIGESSFAGCISLSSITIPDTVETIGNAAFNLCSNLQNITIGSGVTWIGYSAFSNSNADAVVTIYAPTPPTLNNLNTRPDIFNRVKAFYVPCNSVGLYKRAWVWQNYKDKIFAMPNSCTGDSKWIATYTDSHIEEAGCDTSYSITENEVKKSGLSSVEIGDCVTSIGNGTFSGCTDLSAVTLGNGVTNIGSDAFSGCDSLPVEHYIRYADTYAVEAVDTDQTTYTLKNGTRFIGDECFYYCGYLESLDIPDSVISIGSKAFYYNNLNHLTLGNSLINIANSAFTNCDGVTSLTLPDTVQTIGSYAFYKCSGLTNVNIPSGVTSINNYTFAYCGSLTGITIHDNITTIGSYAFAQCSGITNINIPNSVTSIGTDAFSNCSSLTGLTIDSDAALTNNTFSSSKQYIKEITIGDNATNIGSYTFQYCYSLEKLTIGSGVTSIGSDAFSQCTGLTSIDIPNSVTSIGQNAFKNCSSATSINIPGNGSTIIGKYAFQYCEGATSINIGSGVTEIGDWAFNCCYGVTDISIPNNVTNISSNAFRGCRSLTSVTIGNGDTTIGTSAFTFCPNLTIVNIESGIIGQDVFNLCTGITSCELGSGVTSIGSNAFSQCSGLTNIDIPDTVTSIGTGAFQYCKGFTGVTIGTGITSIGMNAFQYCQSLSQIIVKSTTPPTLGSSAFYQTNNAPILVPAESVELYKSTSGWSSYSSRIAAIPT